MKPSQDFYKHIVYWSSLAFLLIIGVYLVIFGRLNYDEGFYLTAGDLVSKGNLPYQDFTFTQGPFLPFLYGFIFKFIEPSLIAGRVIQLILICFGVAVMFKIAQKRFRLSWFILLCTSVCVNWDFLYFSIIVKTYALTFLLMSLIVYLFIERIDRKALMFVLAIFALLTRYSFFPITIAIFAYILNSGSKRDKQWTIGLALAFLVCGCALLPLGKLWEQTVLFHTHLIPDQNLAGRLDKLCYYYSENFSIILALMLVVVPLFVNRRSLKLTRYVWLIISAFLTFGIHAVSPSAQAEYQTVLFPFGVFILVFYLNKYMPEKWGIYFATPLVILSLILPYLSFDTCYGTRDETVSNLIKVKEKVIKIKELAHIENAQTLLDFDMLMSIETGLNTPLKYSMGPFSITSNNQMFLSLVPKGELIQELFYGSYDIVVWSPEMGARVYPSGRPDTAASSDIKLAIEEGYELKDSIENYGQFHSTHYIYKSK